MTKSLLLACFLAVSLEMSAQPAARVFGVLSLIGDNLDVGTHQLATGSNADRNVHDLLPAKDAAFDKFSILAVEDAVNRSEPGAHVKLFAPSTPELFREQERFFDGKKAALPADLQSALQKSGATHLLIITKFRAPTQITLANEKIGSGTLEGIGFYVRSPAFSAARSKDGLDPWQALSAEQKSAALRRLITQETTRVVPMLMGKL